MAAHNETLDTFMAATTGGAIVPPPPAPAEAGRPVLLAVLAGPVSTADDVQAVIQNVPFAQTPGGAPLLFPGADARLTETEPGMSVFNADDPADTASYGAETPFDCGSGSSIDGDMDWLTGD